MKIKYNGFTYSVEPEWIVIDESFSHEFGIHRQYRREVDAINIYGKQNDLGEDVPFDNKDVNLVKVLTNLAEDKLNEN